MPVIYHHSICTIRSVPLLPPWRQYHQSIERQVPHVSHRRPATRTRWQYGRRINAIVDHQTVWRFSISYQRNFIRFLDMIRSFRRVLPVAHMRKYCTDNQEMEMAANADSGRRVVSTRYFIILWRCSNASMYIRKLPCSKPVLSWCGRLCNCIVLVFNDFYYLIVILSLLKMPNNAIRTWFTCRKVVFTSIPSRYLCTIRIQSCKIIAT